MYINILTYFIRFKSNINLGLNILCGHTEGKIFFFWA